MTIKFRPFVSSDLEQYLSKYWAVMVTVGSRTIDTASMRHFVGWYCTRLKVVHLDHHIYAQSLQAQVAQRAKTHELPILFVKGKCIGTVENVKALEEQKLLKDILHHGFEWKTSLDKHPCGPLPSAYGDDELFRGKYRGTPIARAVVKLPSFHPHSQQ